MSDILRHHMLSKKHRTMTYTKKIKSVQCSHLGDISLQKEYCSLHKLRFRQTEKNSSSESSSLSVSSGDGTCPTKKWCCQSSRPKNSDGEIRSVQSLSALLVQLVSRLYGAGTKLVNINQAFIVSKYTVTAELCLCPPPKETAVIFPFFSFFQRQNCFYFVLAFLFHLISLPKTKRDRG